MKAFHAQIVAGCQRVHLERRIRLRGKTRAAVAALLLLTIRGESFSLLGPFHDWMTNDLRFSSASGGPMDLGAGYRWNVPVVTYSFDQAFLGYFGSNGVVAVESAIGVLNSLPPASQLDPSNYLPEATQLNFAAEAAPALDLKSATLTTLLRQLGLGPPTEAAYCLESYVLSNCVVQQASVVGRNFDPVSFSPSTNVDDSPVKYVYVTNCSGSGPGTVSLAVIPDDPNKPFKPAVADGALGPGEFYSGLTRDDVGGIRYLLLTNILHFEALLSDVHGIGTNSGSYVVRAVRPGVEKVTFVRRDYDDLVGEFFYPFTNQFTDTYVTNGTVFQQQVERVSTRPDFIFSALDNNIAGSALTMVISTGPTNWDSSKALPGLGGPGVVRPQVRITFIKPQPNSVLLQTTGPFDAPESALLSATPLWGSFSDSGTVILYPSGVTTGTNNNLLVTLRLHHPNLPSPPTFSWTLRLPPGGQALVETSTNLTNWYLFTTLTNSGQPVNWEHTVASTSSVSPPPPPQFFRVVPK
jgi:hypothetical protein